MATVAFITLGCKVNQFETEVMEGLFKQDGYQTVQHTEVADVYVINTCSVTSLGDKKSRQLIRRVQRQNPDAVIAVTGCYAQIAPDEIKAIQGVRVVLGTANRRRIVEYVEQAIAQQLCDMGIDVIVGGHPHVVEPVDMLQSTVDPEHKTVILYSMGNAVSNQRLGNISYVSTPHTEDGVLFSVTFSKYSDDTVYLEGVDLIPTWVNLNSNDGSRQYNIVPLVDDIRDQWMEKFNMTENQFNSAQRSYDRTEEIVGEGLAKAQEYLAGAKQTREENYLLAVQNPS